jgi:hypothetical protein
MKNIRSLLLAALAFSAVAFSTCTVAHASAADHRAQVSALSFDFAPVPLVAQIDAPAPSAPDKSITLPATPWYADGAVIGAAIAAITSLLAIWSHKEKSKAQMVSESLVVAIEAASKIPQVAAQEKAIKAKLKSEFEALGVQPLVDRIVQDLT